MITYKGREIIGKYLLGQTSHYGEYLAIGCGYNQVINGSLPVLTITGQSKTGGVATITTSQPHKFKVGNLVIIDLNTPNTDYDGERTVTGVTLNSFTFDTTTGTASTSVAGTASLILNPARSVLDFEMIRSPIISKGIENEILDDGTEITKLILKAELPTEQRFKITEVGIFSDASNALAGAYDSKRIAGFLPSEGWVDKNNTEIIRYDDSIVDSAGEIIVPTFGYVTDENEAWNNPSRKITQQPPRYFDRSILVRGNFSDINATTNVPAADTNFIKTNKLTFNFNENSAADKIKLAYALIPKTPADSGPPVNTIIIIDFLNEYSANSSYARWTIHKGINDFTWVDGDKYFYQVEEANKSDFVISSDAFSWAAINGVRIYVAAKDGSNVADPDWYVLLDGMRIDNVSAENPLYGLVGYNIIDTNSGQPVIKRNNTVNFIEFRFSLAV